MNKRGMQFEFRPLAQADLQIPFEWLNRSHVTECWDGPISLNEVRDKYLPRLGSDSRVHPYIGNLNGDPVGFIQS